MRKRKGFSAHPETIWGETLDVVVAKSDKAAERLRRAGVGAIVQLTRRAVAHGVSQVRKRGVIVGWGHHRWDVRVRKDGQKTASSYHVRFWAPVKNRRPA